MSRYPYSPGHRGIDTSIAAAEALKPKLGRLQMMVASVIRHAGALGLTSDELAAKLKTDRWSLRPRISELRRMGVIRDSGERKQNCTGKQAIVWIAT